jgi:hypothetical protein
VDTGGESDYQMDSRWRWRRRRRRSQAMDDFTWSVTIVRSSKTEERE